MRPDEPDDSCSEANADDRIELVEVLPEASPVLSQLHSEICQRETPGPGPEKRVDVKFSAGHAGDAGRQRDEGADHRQQAAGEDGGLSPALEETVGPVQLAAPHENPLAVSLDEWASAVSADLVRNQRAEIAPDRARRRSPKQPHGAFVDQVSGEG